MKKITLYFFLIFCTVCVFANIDESLLRIKNLQLENFDVSEARLVKIGESFNENGKNGVAKKDFVFIRVTAKKSYPSDVQILVALPMPENWNGIFLGLGNGGAGENVNANAVHSGMLGGFASAHCDLGTKYWKTSNRHDEIIKDFGHRAVANMTIVGKEITRVFYQKPIRYSYYSGGSTGGQEGLSLAERHPNFYDAIAVKYPVTNRTRLHLRFAYEANILAAQSYFTDTQIDMISAAIVAQNRNNKGEPHSSTKPYLKYPERAVVDYTKLSFLSEKQIEILKKIHAQVYDGATGEFLTYGLVKSSESSDGGKSLKKGFYCWIYRWLYGEHSSVEDLNVGEYIKELELRWAREMNVLPNLEKFRQLGGKLIIVQGKLDTIVPAEYVKAYYSQLCDKNGGIAQTQKFARLFLVAGGCHGNLQCDVLKYAREWVENGNAPEYIDAIIKIKNVEYPERGELFYKNNLSN